jgi:hypothetical protein
MFFFLALVACAPTPASIKFDNVPANKLTSADPVPVAKATVLDDKKAPIADVKLKWTVSAADNCAKLEGTSVKFTKEGGFCKAKVEAAVEGGTVKNSYDLTFAIPNAVEIGGFAADTVLEVGKDATLTATLKADAEAAEGTVEWKSDNETVASVDASGKVTGKAEGEANISATSGKATSSLKIKVGPAATPVATTPQ